MNTSTIIATQVLKHQGKYTYANYLRLTLFPDFLRLGYIFAPPQTTEDELQQMNSAIVEDLHFDDHPELAAVWDGFWFVASEIEDLLGIRVGNPEEETADLVAIDLEEMGQEEFVKWLTNAQVLETDEYAAVDLGNESEASA